ncbi:hypothetical protein OHS33_22765 [Streptomyces sp. NBC_00536]|uniref:hypothetical protein n=1 Tax=Streptomyces sp. NBC_00536 TaxID=2975769 RepID=UPI002E7FBAF4|nr:hypothetical protein [Streptomyces sp. NBC_00536]WUC80908.1 hypothetical protein OHS33_22765 [Streptomyces sp. NBC_00536]
MGHTLRTSLVTAALTGALAATLLTPATPASYAATGPAVAAPPSPSGTATDGSRYEGVPVYIGKGLVAVLRNKAEGPEAWIRYVGTGWKPGNPYLVRVMDKLDRTHPTTTLSGLHLALTKTNTRTPVLTVTGPGSGTRATASYPLPSAGG